MADKFIDRVRDLKGCFLIPVLRFFLIISLCLIGSGCSHIELSGSIQPETNDLELGENAFFQKDYRAAEKIFTMIIDNNTNPNRINSAQYSLACTRLAQSKTEQEINEAMALLKKWSLSTLAGNQIENAQLLIPGLEKTIKLKEKEQGEGLKKNKQMVEIMNDQKKTIVKLKQMIKTLKHQISELESIDQEIQEKRKNN